MPHITTSSSRKASAVRNTLPTLCSERTLSSTMTKGSFRASLKSSTSKRCKSSTVSFRIVYRFKTAAKIDNFCMPCRPTAKRLCFFGPGTRQGNTGSQNTVHNPVEKPWKNCCQAAKVQSWLRAKSSITAPAMKSWQLGLMDYIFKRQTNRY